MINELIMAENDHPGSCKIDFFTLQREGAYENELDTLDVYEWSGSMICFRQFFDEVTQAYEKQKVEVVRVSEKLARIYKK